MTSPKKNKIQFGKLYFNFCKAMNESFIGNSSYPFNAFAIYFLIAVAIALPVTMGEVYFQSAWHIAAEIVYFSFLVVFLSCTIFFYKKSKWHWCTAVILLLHYVSLADIIAGNQEFGLLYLGLATVFFISYASWKSAKDVNRKGGLIDTLILAIGIACCILGAILMRGQNEFGKIFVIIGVSFIYIYAIARALFWLIYTQEKIKLNLIKTMLYVCFYLALIVGLPFFLLWTGVGKDTLCNVIIPIYAAVVGGILTLAGVAWTIKHNESQRKDEEKALKKPYLILDEIPLDKSTKDIKLNVIINYAGPLKTVFTSTEIYVANNADCIFEGIIIDRKYYVSSRKIYMKQGLWYQISELSFAQSIKTNKFFLIVKDLLGNYYKYECLVKEDVESNAALYYNYICYDIGLPYDLTKEENFIIGSVKESTNE